MLIEVPDGPLATGAPYWYWLGGRPALDFVNTRRERWRRNVECLVDGEDLAGWLAAAELLPVARVPRTPTRVVVAEAWRLREAIDACVVAVAGGRHPWPAALARIDAWLVPVRPGLETGPGGSPVLTERRLADPVHAALGAVALDAALMLGRPDERSRVRICASATCSARFYDRSPAAGRQWCSMAACGNVAKARRHRSRRAGAAT